MRFRDIGVIVRGTHICAYYGNFGDPNPHHYYMVKMGS